MDDSLLKNRFRVYRLQPGRLEYRKSTRRIGLLCALGMPAYRKPVKPYMRLPAPAVFCSNIQLLLHASRTCTEAGQAALP